MLGKVFKYELRASSRFLVPILCGSLAAVVLLVVMQLLSSHFLKFPQGTSAFVLGSVGTALVYMLGIFLTTGIIYVVMGALAVRFYQSFSGGEAYTTFSLPVKVSTHLWGRILVMLVFGAASAALSVLSFSISSPSLILTSSTPLYTGSYGPQSTTITFGDIPTGTLALSVVILFVVFLLSFVCGLLQLYASVAFGGQFTSGRILISVAAYFVLSAIEGLLTLVLIAIPVGIYVSIKGGPDMLFLTLQSLTVEGQFGLIIQWFAAFIGLSMFVSLLFAAVHFLLCNWLYKKRLNLV